MFNFLKEKLKSAISSFSKKAEEEAEVIEEPKQEKKASRKKEAKEPKKIEKKKEVKPKAEQKKKEAKPEKLKKEEPKKAEKKPEPKKEEKKKEPKPVKISEKPVEPQPEEEETAEESEEKEEVPEEPEEEEKEEPKEEKKGFFGKLKDRFTKKEEKPAEKEEEPEEAEAEELPEEEKEEEPEEEVKKEQPEEKEAAEEHEEDKEEAPEEPEEEPKEKKGFFDRIKDAVSTKVLSEKQFDEMFFDLEIALLENNVAMEVVDKIKEDMKSSLVEKRIERGKFEQMVGTTLVSSIRSLFDIEKIDLDKAIKAKKPYIIVFVGVNGSGKTTTISKVAKLMQNKGLKPVIAAADTFRAAAIQQLEEHGKNLGVKVIKHDYGSDPAAVAFDAIKYAGSKGLDVVLIDTAGRQHSNTNLMDEMKKIIRVTKPDLKVFIGESITGNDCIEQAKRFDEAIGIDAIVLTKADVDEKGGAAVSVSYVTGKPILFMGMGQGYDDLKEFDKKLIMENIGLL
ncbi:MAG: signal recognition particle-docking protein FtsY [Nanoarchaeota archaeon]|nr:signal recognition particle-docking protein FtsY [Nanoarchaeota archaeon]